ncbi:hypothetical protein [Microbulbifer aggregans]|uniref:hypothetical protein n=1 Tax=Microbulbifer aggregans TaxID=1769779 RepID=UPI001CFE85A0|nr:hypothetical protein [Microbulbifer aggregans]
MKEYNKTASCQNVNAPSLAPVTALAKNRQWRKMAKPRASPATTPLDKTASCQNVQSPSLTPGPGASSLFSTLLSSNVEMEPVDVFALTSPLTGEEMYVLADGYHRVLAREELGRTDVLARLHTGYKLNDAKLFAHSANVFGKKKATDEDNRGYLEQICQMDGMKERFHKGMMLDLNEVQAMTQIPLPTLRRLTADYRNILKECRDEVIVAAKENDMSVREIAEETGASIGTISGVQKRSVIENEQTPSLTRDVPPSSLFSDSLDEETVSMERKPLPVKEAKVENYEEKKARVEKRMDEAWGTLARDSAKLEGRVEKSAEKLAVELIRNISAMVGKLRELS